MIDGRLDYVFGFLALETIFESEKVEISSKIQVKNKPKFFYVQFMQTLLLFRGHFAICNFDGKQCKNTQMSLDNTWPYSFIHAGLDVLS